MTEVLRFSRSELLQPPRYGCFLWWPLPGWDWIHEDDRFVADHLIPGNRILTCNVAEEGWNLFTYGRHSFRARPALWTEVPQPRFPLGSFVEVLSRMGRVSPLVATVREALWDRHHGVGLYQLSIAGRKLVRPYTDEELVICSRIGEPRQLVPPDEPLKPGGYLVERTPDPAQLEGPELKIGPP